MTTFDQFIGQRMNERALDPAPVPAPTQPAKSFDEFLAGQDEVARERARMAIEFSRETTADDAARALDMSRRAPELVGTDIPPQVFLTQTEDELTAAFRKAETDVKLRSNQRLSSWVTRDPVNAIVVREYGEELGAVTQTLESLGQSFSSMGTTFRHRLFGVNPALDALRTAEQGRADAGTDAAKIVDDEYRRTLGDNPDRGFGGRVFDRMGMLIEAWTDPLAVTRRAAERVREARTPATDERLDALRGEAVTALRAEARARQTDADYYRRGVRVTAVDRRLAEVEALEGLGTWERFSRQMGALTEDPVDGLAWLAAVTLESGVPMAAGVVTTATTKSPVLGAAVMGAGAGFYAQGASWQDQAKAAGFDLTTEEGVKAFVRSPEIRELVRERNNAYGITIAVVAALSGGIAGRQLSQSLAGELAVQGLVQAVMGSGGEALALLASDQELDPFEIAIEGLAEFMTVPVEVFGVGGQAISSRVRERRAAQDARAFFERLAGQSEGSTLRSKMPEKYAEAVAELTKNGPVETVQIDAAGLDKLFQSGRLTPEALTSVIPGLTVEQITALVADGGNLELKTADYAAYVAGTELDQMIRQHMRINGSMTTAELDAMDAENEALMRQLDEGIREVESGVARLGQTLEGEHQRLKEELVAAGRAPRVADAEAAQLVVFARVMAQRLGVPVEDFLAENPLPRVFGGDVTDVTEIAVDDLADARRTNGPDAAVIEAAAQAAGLTEDATNDELADALRAYAGIGAPAGLDESTEAASQRIAARRALDGTRLNQSSETLTESPLPVVPTGGRNGGRLTIQDIARALTDDLIVREGRKLDPLHNTADKAQIIDDMQRELEFQLRTSADSGGEWYVEDVNAAMEVTKKIIPELADDPVKQRLFITIAALLSPQNNPVNNWEDAVQAFSVYLRTGELVDRRPNGKRYGVSSGTSLPLLGYLIRERGELGALDWLLTEKTGREMAELRRASGIFKDGDQTRKLAEYLPKDVTFGTTDLGMAMFGPKVSDFMLNATGINADAVTVDLWLMRTFGRHRGTLLDAPEKTLAEGGIYDQPTKSDRAMLDEIVTEIARRTRKTPSAVQAILWYYEQRLWRAHGANTDSRNFRQGAEKAADKRGVSYDLDETSGGRGVQRAPEVVARTEDPVGPEDLLGPLDAAFFGRPGWAILTADGSTVADPVRRKRQNRENEQRLVADLEKAGIPYRPVTGRYGGDPEMSYVILADEETAVRLGGRYGQDSVLTRDGFVYPRGAPNTPTAGTLLRGQAAIDTGFYSIDDGGYAFALQMDFSRGPGKPVMPFGHREVKGRPQLPVRERDGKVALYHWSSERRDTIDPAKAGTGPLKNAVNRGARSSFWGINIRSNRRDPGTGYVKEPGLGDFVHMALVDPEQLYPYFEDPDGLMPTEGTAGQQAAAYRRAVKDAGYLGVYFTDDGTGRAPLGNVAELFDAIPVEHSVAAMVGAREDYRRIAEHPDVLAAVAEAESRTPTATGAQMLDADFRATRTYVFGETEVTGVDAAAERLLEDALTLGWSELRMAPEPVARDRVAVIIMGPPAAGKSTDANRLAVAMKAAIIDSDEAKKVIPGFDGGIGAGAVHEESSYIGKMVLAQALEAGYNVIVPKVGDSAGSIEKLRKQLVAAGYTVQLRLKDVTPDEAFRRMFGRFAETGRLILPSFMENAVTKPPQVFAELEAKGDFDGYRRGESVSDIGPVERAAGRPGGRSGDAGDDGARGQPRAGKARAGSARGGDEAGGRELNQGPAAYRLPDLEKASPGPVPGVRELATKYMRDNGLPVRHQASYVKVDIDRAREIARLYDEAVDAPGDPEVRAAYDALAKETIAQYEALLELGFAFDWIEGDDPYATPADAIRDMQENKHLWVFPTTAGFGTLTVADGQNPLLQLTDQVVSGRQAMVNDLFRIVHDVFGHGSEGASFGPRGEENAWQAHVRMFSPLAARAMTAETRGQNSWVNYGPFGEQNRRSPKDTIFADQKTTLLPEWVSAVGQAEDLPLDAEGNPRLAPVVPDQAFRRGAKLTQDNRGSIILPPPGTGRAPVVSLFAKADLSTVLHESAHYFLWTYQKMADQNPAVAQELELLKGWWRANAEGVAKDAGGPVTQAMVEQYLNTGTTGDDALDAAVWIGMHEQFARAFEAYLMEGRAPSGETAGLFDMFSSWLISIYRSIRGLNVKLDDDVRGVFDRMLATDDEIARARARQPSSDLVGSAADLGITDEEYAALQKLSVEAQEEARRELLAAVMQPMLDQKKQAYADRRAAITAEVQERVWAKPVHRVREWLGNGRWLGAEADPGLPDADLLRMDREMLNRDFPGVADQLPRGRYPLWGRGTDVHPEEIATLFGFSSADDMLTKLVDAPKMDVEIKAEVDRQLREEFGDPLVDGTIPELAVAALNGEKRGDLIAAELRVMARQASRGRPVTTRSYVREVARRKIAGLPVREAVKWRGFQTAMQRAGERAQQALARGDIDEAYEAKRQELFNHATYMEARKAEEDLAKTERRVARLKKASSRKNIDGVYLAAIDEVMDRYDFRRRTAQSERRRGALNAYIDMMRAAGRENELAIPPAVLAEAARRPYKTLTMQELRGVLDTLVNIEYTGRRKRKLLDAKRQRDLDTAVADALASAAQNVRGTPVPRTAAGEGFASGLRHFLNLALNANTLLREYDGFTFGKMYDLIKAPIDEASNVAQTMRTEAAERLEEIYGIYSAEERRAMANLRKYPELRTARDKEANFSRWDLISMALNMGNEDNLNRLMDRDNGYGFSQQQVDFVKGALSTTDWAFVQSVWRHIDSYWPLIEARERRQTGVVPAKVEAVAFTLPSGQVIRGGYYPIRYDRRLKARTDAEEIAQLQMNMLSGQFGKAQTRNGFTKERAAGSGGRALQLGMEVYHQHLSEVIHDLAFSEAVNNAWRVLQHPEMVSFFEANGRSPDRQALELWVQDVATGAVTAGGVLGRFAMKVKSNFTLSKLAFNLSTVAVQMTGVAQSAVVVGKVPLAKAYVQYAGGPAKWAALVHERSVYMRTRETTFHRDIFDLMGDLNSSPLDSRWQQFQQGIARVGFWLMMKVQYYGVDLPTWLAAYDNALAEGQTDEQAVANADRAVARAQASGLVADRAAFERGTLSADSRQSGFIKLFTTLGSYMFAKGNIAYERVNRGRREIRDAGFSARAFVAALSTAFDLALLFTLEALLYRAIRGELPDDEDDEEGDGTADEWAAFLTRETAFAVMGSIPIIREASSALQGFSGGGAYGSIAETMAAPLVQAAQGEVDLAAVKAVSNAVGVATGLPSAQANRMIDGVWRWQEGDDVALIEFIMGRRQ